MQPKLVENLTLQTLLIQQSIEDGEFDNLEELFEKRQKLVEAVMANPNMPISEDEKVQFEAANLALESLLRQQCEASVSEIQAMRRTNMALRSYRRASAS